MRSGRLALAAALALVAASQAACDSPREDLPSGERPTLAPSQAPGPSTVGMPARSGAPPSSAAIDDGLETVDDEPEREEGADPGASCAPIDPGLKPMELQRFAFASAVAKKRPTDTLTTAHPGQRVYAHVTLRNRSGVDRCVKLTLAVNGDERTNHTFKVGKSWSWRTWGYITLRPDDRGKLEAVVRDDQGAELARQVLPIAPSR